MNFHHRLQFSKAVGCFKMLANQEDTPDQTGKALLHFLYLALAVIGKAIR